MVYKRHFGVVKTLDLVTRNYLWPKVRHLSWTDYVSTCDVSCRSKIPEHRLYDLFILVGPWKSISVDFITDIPSSKGYDVFLQWLIAYEDGIFSSMYKNFYQSGNDKSYITNFA